MHFPVYVRIEEKNANDLMAQVNKHAESGYRLSRWYENPDKDVFMAIMEMRRK